MISITLFWTAIVICVTVMAALIFVIARLHWLRKTDVSELDSQLSMQMEINEHQADMLKKAHYACSRCGKMVGTKPHWVDNEPACGDCYAKHLNVKRRVVEC